jgi:regulatory protein
LQIIRTRKENDELVALWQRRYGSPPQDEKEKNRQIRYLISRGYELGKVLALMKAIHKCRV